MRVLVLGAGGMLGHKLWQVFRDRFDTWGTVRGRPGSYTRFGIFDEKRLIGAVDAADPDSLVRAFATVQPDAVVNCIGVIKQLKEAEEHVPSIAINALFPHRLAELCRAGRARMIHVSTDCVFSGRKGNYTEDGVSDAEDLYGRTKFLGEVAGPACSTIRTSMIGRSLTPGPGLIDWFFGKRGRTVQGYAKAVFSGLTTFALGHVIADILERHPDLNGLWHVSSDPISKHDVLKLVNDAFGLGITLQRETTFTCDRSLDSTRWRRKTGYVLPGWDEMIAQMVSDPTPYGRESVNSRVIC